ncbi:MAG: 50S ribosomal protein L25 [Dehalococcoidia bacterium]|nr:50S ribosomal protein L25 [Dehalococcoidia bacterium]
MAEERPRLELRARRRQLLGKAVKRLRRHGITPANIYGRGIASVAIEVSTQELLRLLRRAGGHEMIYVVLDGEEPRPCFLKEVQRDPITDELLHVEFHQVSLTEKVRLEVPLHLVGEAPAVKELGATLLQPLETVVVEGLPTAIPPFIEVDVTALREPGQAIHVGDLKTPEGVAILSDAHLVVAQVVLEEEAAEEEEAAPAEVEVIRPAREEEEEEGG